MFDKIPLWGWIVGGIAAYYLWNQSQGQWNQSQGQFSVPLPTIRSSDVPNGSVIFADGTVQLPDGQKAKVVG